MFLDWLIFACMRGPRQDAIRDVCFPTVAAMSSWFWPARLAIMHNHRVPCLSASLERCAPTSASSHLGEREVGEGDDVQRSGLGVSWKEEGNGRDGEGSGGHGGTAEWESSARRVAGRWTPAPRSATAMPRCSASGEQNCRDAISWQRSMCQTG